MTLHWGWRQLTWARLPLFQFSLATIRRTRGNKSVASSIFHTGGNQLYTPRLICIHAFLRLAKQSRRVPGRVRGQATRQKILNCLISLGTSFFQSYFSIERLIWDSLYFFQPMHTLLFQRAGYWFFCLSLLVWQIRVIYMYCTSSHRLHCIPFFLRFWIFISCNIISPGKIFR